ncbi:hypothetical protein [Leptospira alexanderi]|uniref:hypothetical protein n=1 Tax=Leptospira alexanderi TaxID=100053 RepID=UPI00028852BC|nr:hypothetical protein [Leptospira alexanderi]
MNKTNLENIYKDILELSDKEKQKQYWFGKNHEHISSYVELMCRLFDDNNFEEFVDNIKNYKGSKLRESLISLKELLESYDEGDKEDTEILLDPQWDLIVEQARKVISVWDIDIS